MAKRPQRTPEQQEYRDNLAHDVKNLRKHGDAGRELATALLASKQKTYQYENAETKKLRKREEKDEVVNKQIREEIEKGNFDSAEELIFSALIDDNKVDSQIADKLSEAGYFDMVWENKEAFKNLGNLTYDKLRESKWNGVYDMKKDEFFENIDIFSDHNHIVIDWIASGLIRQSECIGALQKCRGLNSETYKNLLKTFGFDILIGSISEHTFSGLDKELFPEILKMINLSNLRNMKNFMKCFSGLDKESFLYAWKIYYEHVNDGNRLFSSPELKVFAENILENIDEFEGLDREVAEKLIELGYGDIVAQHPEKFGLKKEK